MGGLLADPVLTLPGLFGEGAIWGFDWITRYPYAVPSLINTVALAITGSIVFFGLEEVWTDGALYCLKLIIIRH